MPFKFMTETEKTPIKTFIRIKPSKNNLNIKYTKETLTYSKPSGETLQYTLDSIFDPHISQKQIYEHIKPILKNIIKGLNNTIFCYGNTGSGKTYTMFGTKENPGIVYNFVINMFDYFSSISELFDIKVLFSYFQIYNEKVFDMFNNNELVLREFKEVVIIKDLTEKRIETIDEFIVHFEQANKNRKVGSTSLNEFSSRSHTILRFDFIVDKKCSHLYLIDLAGSENNKKTGNEGMRLIESTNINRSLFVLNQVVNAIVNKQTSIPYRDSKLTRVLKDSLGGSSFCYILGCIEPEKQEETLRTLEFVAKSRKIICEVKSTVGAYISEKKESVYDKARQQIAKKNIKNDIFNAKLKFVQKNKDNINERTGFYQKTNILQNNNINKPHHRIVLGEKDINTKKLLRKNNSKFTENSRNVKILNFYDSSTFSLNKTIVTTPIKKKKNKKAKKEIITYTREEILQMLNSGNFIEIKKVKGLGDKRASVVIDYVKNHGQFTSIEQLKNVFSQKIYEKIIKECHL